MTLIDKLVQTFPALNNIDNIKKLEEIINNCQTEQERYYRHLNQKVAAKQALLEIKMCAYKMLK